MIKMVIMLLLLLPYKSSASSTPYLSFFNLITSPESYNSEEVKLSGYFLYTDEEGVPLYDDGDLLYQRKRKGESKRTK
ncbi:hypothetical protein AWH60_11005 [Pseudoalteromonas haloplanktis]|nr:hypothetical protein AWH60_11005 [Pseudoalteromonas haloplanktis]